jgi:hypothetical protein
MDHPRSLAVKTISQTTSRPLGVSELTADSVNAVGSKQNPADVLEPRLRLSGNETHESRHVWGTRKSPHHSKLSESMSTTSQI